MEDDRGARVDRTPDAAALLAIAAIAVAIGELAIFRRPDLTRSASAFFFGDAGYSLFTASEVLRGARLYRDVAYPYGWLPVALYSGIAACFGNTPTVYLEFLLACSSIGLLLAYGLFRRLLSPVAAALVTIGGLLPVFLVPGSLLGGYLSSYYMPIERTLLVAAALVWRPAPGRRLRRSIALGAIVAALQMTRFGPGLVLGAVLVGLDGLLLLRSGTRRLLAEWIRSSLPIVAAAAAGELLLALAAFAMLPRPIAQDVVWPAYFVQVFDPHLRRWPDLSNWRLVVAQYANPLASVALTSWAAWAWARRRPRVDDDAWSLLLLPLLFLGGVFTFLRTDHHVRQFAWVFVPGSVAALAECRRCRLLAAAGWMPVAAVVALSVVRPADPARTMMSLPDGWRVSASAAEEGRIEGIRASLSSIAARTGGGPVLFDPTGPGFHVVYGVPHVGRQTWFYQAAVRPYEIDDLRMQFDALTAVVACGAPPADTAASMLSSAFPEALRPAIASRASEPVWSDGQCRVFRLMPARIDRQRGAAGR